MGEGRAAWPVGVGMITPTSNSNIQFQHSIPTSNSNITCHTIHTTPYHTMPRSPAEPSIKRSCPSSQPSLYLSRLTGASSTEQEASLLGKNTGSMLLLLLTPSITHLLLPLFPLPRPNGTAATMTAYSRCRSTKSHFTSGLHTILYKPTALDARTVKQWLVWSGPMRSEVAFRTEK